MLTNVQWTQVKKPSDIVLEGVDVELDWTDSTNVQSIIVRDGKGNSLRIIKGEYSGMRALIPATVEKYRLSGTLCGSPFEQVFDEEHHAEERQRELGDLGDKAVLKIEKVKVPA